MDATAKKSIKNVHILKKIIFPPHLGVGTSQVKIDDESFKYVTFHISAQEITNIIMNSLNDFPCTNASLSLAWDSMSPTTRMSELVITDMTAGVGGNVLNFANYFKYVNAIEIDPIRCSYLQSNAELYGFLNVNTYATDSVELLVRSDNINQDIIFFDPPWGGSDYKKHLGLKLTFGIGDIPIEKICTDIFSKDRSRNRTQIIVLKLPNNYDFEYFRSEVMPYVPIIYHLDRMTIVILKRYT